MLLQNTLQSLAVDGSVGGQLVDDVGQVGEEVALVAVGEDGRHAGVVKLDVLVGYAHEVHGCVLRHKGREGLGDDLRDFALTVC
jgi:hypothetical protein